MAALKPDLVAQCWTSFRVAVIPPEAGSAQVRDLRRAFYAGAQGLLSTIMKVMDDGEEPTEADLLQMTAVADELDAFGLAVGRGEA